MLFPLQPTLRVFWPGRRCLVSRDERVICRSQIDCLSCLTYHHMGWQLPTLPSHVDHPGKLSILSLLRTIPCAQGWLGLFLSSCAHVRGRTLCSPLSLVACWKGNLVLSFSFNHFLRSQVSLITVLKVQCVCKALYFQRGKRCCSFPPSLVLSTLGLLKAPNCTVYLL